MHIEKKTLSLRPGCNERVLKAMSQQQVFRAAPEFEVIRHRAARVMNPMPAPVQSEAEFQSEIEKAYRAFCIEEEAKQTAKANEASSLRVSKCRIVERGGSEDDDDEVVKLASLEATHNSRKQAEGAAAKLGLNPAKLRETVRPHGSTFGGVRSRDILVGTDLPFSDSSS